MTSKDRLNVGVVGSVGRGRSFAAPFEAAGATIHAICDIQADRLDESAKALGAREQYVDYEEMIEKSDLDAVVVGTPMPLHVTQSIAALARGLHVLCEVPAAVSIDECRDLVLAAAQSKAVYMMAENYIYTRPNSVVRSLARAGLFGELYYAEGEYLHELKDLNERTTWRRKWQTGIEGVTYGTHSLGPILAWMGGDRVVRVCCEANQPHHRDPRGRPYQGESPVMLCRTARGALIKIRVDMISDRPHAMTNYQLQGTDGVYESSRGGPGDRNRIWLRSLSEKVTWHDLDELIALDAWAEQHVPEMWRQPPPEAKRAGHGGGDYFEVMDFIDAVRGRFPCPLGVHESMDITLPGLVSQQSILQGGRWLDVPDSRSWTGQRPGPQLHMLWPAERLADPPTPQLPAGFRLRHFRDADSAAYVALMAAAGFDGWDDERIERVRHSVLPCGFFVIEHEASGRLVATAQAHHQPLPMHPGGGEVGWVAADPAHKGKGLGLAVTAAAVGRLARAGYERIFLRTDDHRLPALKVYLKLGFEPFPYAEGMPERWQAVREALGGKTS